MTFEHTMRWFGPHDPITLKEIKQTGATGIVTALHEIPVGEVWCTPAIKKRKKLIEDEGLKWSVVESLPVHEDIKKRKGNYKKYIENYVTSIENLGHCGIDIICYNFMPVLDWSRTDLHVKAKDGSITTKFDSIVFAAFDLFILKRPQAQNEYTDEQIQNAKIHFNNLTNDEKNKLVETILYGLPGSLEAYTLAEFKKAVDEYNREIPEEVLRENLYSFIKEIIPAAEEAGVYMAIHPDDPPWPLLGLPRIVSNSDDIEKIINVYDSPHNGLTLCTGSYGADIYNDLIEITKKFAHRISFLHLRNVKRNVNKDFIEETHLEGEINIPSVMKILISEQNKRKKEGRRDHKMPIRPDHGNLMIPEFSKEGIYPGYSLFGRMRGLAELRGLELGIRKSLNML